MRLAGDRVVRPGSPEAKHPPRIRAPRRRSSAVSTPLGTVTRSRAVPGRVRIAAERKFTPPPMPKPVRAAAARAIKTPTGIQAVSKKDYQLLAQHQRTVKQAVVKFNQQRRSDKEAVSAYVRGQRQVAQFNLDELRRSGRPERYTPISRKTAATWVRNPEKARQAYFKNPNLSDEPLVQALVPQAAARAGFGLEAQAYKQEAAGHRAALKPGVSLTSLAQGTIGRGAGARTAANFNRAYTQGIRVQGPTALKATLRTVTPLDLLVGAGIGRAGELGGRALTGGVRDIRAVTRGVRDIRAIRRSLPIASGKPGRQMVRALRRDVMASLPARERYAIRAKRVGVNVGKGSLYATITAAKETLGHPWRTALASTVGPELAAGRGPKRALEGTSPVQTSLAALNAPGVLGLPVHVIRDALNLPANMLPMVYLPATAITHGDTQALHDLLQSFVENDAGASFLTGHMGDFVRNLYEHPLYAGLELAGIYAVGGRLHGAVLRAAPGTRGDYGINYMTGIGTRESVPYGFRRGEEPRGASPNYWTGIIQRKLIDPRLKEAWDAGAGIPSKTRPKNVGLLAWARAGQLRRSAEGKTVQAAEAIRRGQNSKFDEQVNALGYKLDLGEATPAVGLAARNLLRGGDAFATSARQLIAAGEASLRATKMGPEGRPVLTFPHNSPARTVIENNLHALKIVVKNPEYWRPRIGAARKAFKDTYGKVERDLLTERILFGDAGDPFDVALRAAHKPSAIFHGGGPGGAPGFYFGEAATNAERAAAAARGEEPLPGGIVKDIPATEARVVPNEPPATPGGPPAPRPSQPPPSGAGEAAIQSLDAQMAERRGLNAPPSEVTHESIDLTDPSLRGAAEAPIRGFVTADGQVYHWTDGVRHGQRINEVGKPSIGEFTVIDGSATGFFTPEAAAAAERAGYTVLDLRKPGASTDEEFVRDISEGDVPTFEEDYEGIDTINHTVGEAGRGFVDGDGSVHTWGGQGDDRDHQTYALQHGIADPQAKFWIKPDGSLSEIAADRGAIDEMAVVDAIRRAGFEPDPAQVLPGSENIARAIRGEKLDPTEGARRVADRLKRARAAADKLSNLDLRDLKEAQQTKMLDTMFREFAGVNPGFVGQALADRMGRVRRRIQQGRGKTALNKLRDDFVSVLEAEARNRTEELGRMQLEADGVGPPALLSGPEQGALPPGGGAQPPAVPPSGGGGQQPPPEGGTGGTIPPLRQGVETVRVPTPELVQWSNETAGWGPEHGGAMPIHLSEAPSTLPYLSSAKQSFAGTGISKAVTTGETAKALASPSDLEHILNTVRARQRRSTRIASIKQIIDDQSSLPLYDAQGNRITLGTARQAAEAMYRRGFKDEDFYLVNREAYTRPEEAAKLIEEGSPEGYELDTLSELYDEDGGLVQNAIADPARVGATDTPGDWTAIPRTTGDEMLGQAHPHSRVEKVSAAITYAFKSAVLPTSPKWLFANYFDTTMRALINGLVPPPLGAVAGRYNLGRVAVTRNVIAASKHSAAGSGLESQFIPRGLTGSQAESRGGYAWKHDPEKYTRTPFSKQDVGQMLQLTSALREAKGVHQLASFFAKYRHNVYKFNGGLVEEPLFEAMFGKVAGKTLKGYFDQWGKTMETQEAAYKSLAGALENDPGTALAFARQLNKQTGNWNMLSQSERFIMRNFAPFYMWYRSASRFVLLTMPINHPVMTGIIAAAANMTDEERKALGLDWFDPLPDGATRVPSYLMGGLPRGGGLLSTSTQTSFGVFADYPSSLAQAILPQYNSLLRALAGLKWSGSQLVNPDGSALRPDQKFGAAALLLLESYLPWASIGAHILARGRSEQYPGSYLGDKSMSFWKSFVTAISPTPLPGARVYKPSAAPGAGGGGRHPSPGGGVTPLGGSSSPGVAPLGGGSSSGVTPLGG